MGLKVRLGFTRAEGAVRQLHAQTGKSADFVRRSSLGVRGNSVVRKKLREVDCLRHGEYSGRYAEAAFETPIPSTVTMPASATSITAILLSSLWGKPSLFLDANLIVGRPNNLLSRQSINDRASKPLFPCATCVNQLIQRGLHAP